MPFTQADWEEFLKLTVEREREKREEHHIDWLPPTCTPNGDQTHNLVCTLTENQTHHLSVHGMMLNQLSGTSRTGGVFKKGNQK